MLEQHFQIVQHRAHAARRLRDQGVDEPQILEKKFGIAHPAGGGRRAGEQQFDHRARGFRRQHKRGGRQIGHHVLADFLRHLRGIDDPGFDQRVAAPQPTNGGHALQVVIQPAW